MPAPAGPPPAGRERPRRSAALHPARPQPPPPTPAPAPPVTAPVPLDGGPARRARTAGTPNLPTRRFCGRCGQPLAARGSADRAPPSAQRSRLVELGATRGEARVPPQPARRSTGGAASSSRCSRSCWSSSLVSVMGRDPVGWVKHRWYDLRGTTVPVAGVTAVARSRAPRRRRWTRCWTLTRRRMATHWVAGSAPTTSCAKAEPAGYVELRWEPRSGCGCSRWTPASPQGTNDRDLEFRPETILVSYRTASGSGALAGHASSTRAAQESRAGHRE